MKERNCFIDTNIFLRVLLKDDLGKFEDCVKFLNELKKGKIKGLTSNLILAEVNWTLLRLFKFPKDRVVKGIASILNLKNLKIKDNFDSYLALKIYKEFSVKFIDALIASNPKIYRGDIILISYDKDFDKIKGIIRKEPKEML